MRYNLYELKHLKSGFIYLRKKIVDKFTLVTNFKIFYY